MRVERATVAFATVAYRLPFRSSSSGTDGRCRSACGNGEVIFTSALTVDAARTPGVGPAVGNPPCRAPRNPSGNNADLNLFGHRGDELVLVVPAGSLPPDHAFEGPSSDTAIVCPHDIDHVGLEQAKGILPFARNVTHDDQAILLATLDEDSSVTPGTSRNTPRPATAAAFWGIARFVEVTFDEPASARTPEIRGGA